MPGIKPAADAQSESCFVFPRDSAIWRISRESVLLLGGPAAAILQIAHPEVAHGVAAHSDFRRDTLGRLHRTLDAVYTITFSRRAEAEAMAERIHAAHARVRGESPEPYSAFSPDAQLWVLATLIQTSLEVYERFLQPLALRDREDYYRDMRSFGRFFGLAPDYGPRDWGEFSNYYRGMLEGERLGRLEISAELARHIAYPRVPAALRLLWPLSGLATREFLPSPVRERLGFAANPSLAASVLDGSVQCLLPVLPDRLRYCRQYLRVREIS